MLHRNVRTVAALATMALLAACGDARLGKLALGISADSVGRLMGEAPHRTNAYQTAGKTWQVDFYARSAAVEKDSIAWREMSPVVYIDGKTVGWGWSWWSDASEKQHLAMPK